MKIDRKFSYLMHAIESSKGLETKNTSALLLEMLANAPKPIQ